MSSRLLSAQVRELAAEIFCRLYVEHHGKVGVPVSLLAEAAIGAAEQFYNVLHDEKFGEGIPPVDEPKCGCAVEAEDERR